MTSISSPFVKDASFCSASLSLASTSVEDESIDTPDRKLDLVQVRANTSNDTIDNVSLSLYVIISNEGKLYEFVC